MLVVVSEINNLASLNARGVYPDEFYTDLELFKHRVVFMKDARVVFIFAGSSHFNKRLAVEFIKSLMQRANSATDSGLIGVHVISDVTLAGLGAYYKYRGSLDSVDLMHFWNVQQENIDIWTKLKSEPKESTCYFNAYDRGEADALIETCKEALSVQDPYVNLIKVPDLKQLFATAG